MDEASSQTDLVTIGGITMSRFTNQLLLRKLTL